MFATPAPQPATDSPQPASWIVVYDPDCGFCRTALALILRSDRNHALRPLALGTDEADTLLADMTPEQRDASWHLVSPAGHRESAGAAGPPLLRLLPGGKVPAAALGRLPTQTQRGYEWVAEHRSSLSHLIPDPIKKGATRLIERRAREQA